MITVTTATEDKLENDYCGVCDCAGVEETSLVF